MKTSLYLYCLLLPIFFKFCPIPSHLQPLTKMLFFTARFRWLNGYMCHIWYLVSLSYIMDLLWYYEHVEAWYLSTSRTLFCVICNKVLNLLRSGTWCGNLVFKPMRYLQIFQCNICAKMDNYNMSTISSFGQQSDNCVLLNRRTHWDKCKI